MAAQPSSRSDFPVPISASPPSLPGLPAAVQGGGGEGGQRLLPALRDGEGQDQGPGHRHHLQRQDAVQLGGAGPLPPPSSSSLIPLSVDESDEVHADELEVGSGLGDEQVHQAGVVGDVRGGRFVIPDCQKVLGWKLYIWTCDICVRKLCHHHWLIHVVWGPSV